MTKQSGSSVLPKHETSPEASAIPALTGLRFLAATCVAYAHFNSVAQLTFLGFPLDVAPLGMSIFFCLSGFIIHYVYAHDFNKDWSASAKDFALARFSRLYPLFAFFVLFGVCFYPLLRGALSNPAIAASYLTLTGTWWYWTYEGKTLIQLPFGISWSIATEWFFYCAYALILYRIASIRSALVCVAAIIGTLVAGIAIMMIGYRSAGTWEPIVLSAIPGSIKASVDFNNSFYRWLFYVSPYARIFEFIAGCMVCQLYFLMRHNRRYGDILFWSGIAVMSITTASYIYMASPTGHAFTHSSWIFVFIRFMHMNLLFAPGILLVILGAALGSRGAKAIFGSTAVVYLGEISYSIYLGHPWIATFAHVPANFDHKLLGLSLDIAAACIVAAGLYTLIEMPAKRWLRKMPWLVASAAKFTSRLTARTEI